MDFVVIREIFMEITSQSQIGRAVELSLTPVASLTHDLSQAPQYDKWEVLNALTQAAEHFELSHRTLCVLKALATFLPERDITALPGSAIVFPANRTLSTRLSGMPESTLRRHLARLVDLGIIKRHDSANRKRFARRVGGNVQIAFGFDLAPLALHANQIFDAAQHIQHQTEQLRVLRDQVIQLRQQLVELDEGADHSQLIAHAGRVLRRKPEANSLLNLIDAIKAGIETSRQSAVDPGGVLVKPMELSGSDIQIERHIQDSINQSFDSEEEGQGSNQCAQDTECELPGENAESSKDPSLSLLKSVCREIQSYFPDFGWSKQEIYRIADQVAPMLGIDQPVLHQARQSMGPLNASISIMCILERTHDIRSPGAYLRRLSQKAQIGQFSTLPMVQALSKRHSARNCQVTI
ncbi:plasmid replication protein RepC (plasmid) [Aliisedimentitalea scapharcae]|uniref:Plasmid replication protein RepC n=1 Tax=Aliisedimentitalea scapharcae TaxID=1524259 RepID=A0ABZ2Y310_9RHOB